MGPDYNLWTRHGWSNFMGRILSCWYCGWFWRDVRSCTRRSTTKVFKDKLGWPIERIKGHPVLNFFRILIHARSYGEFSYTPPASDDDSVGCQASPPETSAIPTGGTR